jgi:DNA polymerase-1
VTMPPKLYGGVRLLDRPSYRNVELLARNAMPMVCAFQRNGLLIDRGHFERLRARYTSEMDELTQRVRDITGKHTDLSSADQVAELLMGHMGLDPDGLKMTKKQKRYQVDNKGLMMLHEQCPEVIEPILNHREIDKLRGTYAEGILSAISDDGRLHPKLKHATVVSGRYSAQDPNVLALPSRTDRGKELSEGIIAGPGKVIVLIDYSQIEIRVQAHLGSVAAMIETYRNNGDFHTDTTARMFRIARETVTKDKRLAGKTTGLGVMYDITGEGLWWQFVKVGLLGKYTVAECEEFIRQYFEAYPEILDFRKAQFLRMRRFGCVWDLFGRIRNIPEVKSVHNWIQSAGMRAGCNLPVQGTAAGIIKLAMAKIQDIIDDNDLAGQVDPLLQIHDALMFEVDEPIADDIMGWFSQEMNSVIPDGMFQVPILSEPGKGANMAGAK